MCHSELPFHLTCMSLGWGIEMVHLVETHSWWTYKQKQCRLLCHNLYHNHCLLLKFIYILLHYLYFCVTCGCILEQILVPFFKSILPQSREQAESKPSPKRTAQKKYSDSISGVEKGSIPTMNKPVHHSFYYLLPAAWLGRIYSALA